MNAFPLNFGPDGAEDGRFYRTASGEWIPHGGAWQFKGYDENGLLQSLNGRLIHDPDLQQNWSGNENSF